MSMEMHVLFGGKLPSKAALTRAMKELGFPLSIVPSGGSLEQQTGFMPMRFQGEETGMEFDVFSGRADVENVAGEHVNNLAPNFDRSANFRWGGDEMEMLASMCAAAALAKLVNGIVIEEAEGLLLSVDEAIAFARKHLDAVKPPDKRWGTRPADIKRYLRPLLKQRNDLVQVGRLLVVRPVRHLLRGALLDRTSDKHLFRVWRYIQPLFGFAGSVGCDDYIHDGLFEVWQPHFAPLLIDVLAEDIFGQVGGMTTLTDFAGFIEKTGFREKRVTALVLAGELERAAEYVEQIQRDDAIEGYAKASVKTHWDRVSGDIEATCAEFHAKEAETVKALKLDHIWEPSPFPVELPLAERGTQSAEPLFSTTPWVARPPWLLQEVPERPGEVRFAKNTLRRNGRVILLVPLTSEEAEERHREHEGYALITRLPDGLLLVTRRNIWRGDRNDPERPSYPSGYRPPASFVVELYGSSHAAQLSAWQDNEDESLIELWSIDVYERLTHDSTWQYHASLKEGERSIHDSRTGKMVHTETSLTSAERDLVRCPMPDFGEYAELVARIRSLLHYAGYGALT